MAKKKKVLILVDWYLPGFKAGGPIRSVSNLVKLLDEDFEVRILTGDRDFTDLFPYENIQFDVWVKGPDGAKVFYCSESKMTRHNFRVLMDEFAPDMLYFNSMFSKEFTLKPLRWSTEYSGLRRILAPRGMLHPGALSLKKTKKRLFLALFRMFGMHKRIEFHATDEAERRHIKEVFGEDKPVHLAANLPSPLPNTPTKKSKVAGSLNLCFVSRVTAKKNLDSLLEMLADVKGRVNFKVIGTQEDAEYLAICHRIGNKLPGNIKLRWEDPVPQTELQGTWDESHFFVLPTRGENFGHSIFESLAAGVPVILSDQTPWRKLESQKAGWDIPLSKRKEFVAAVQRAVDMDETEYAEWQAGAYNCAARFVKESGVLEKSLNLFADGEN